MSAPEDGPMTCEQALIEIIDAMSGPLSDELSAHLMGCPDCAEEYRMAVETWVLLNSTKGPAPSRLYEYRLAYRNVADTAASGGNSQDHAPKRALPPATRWRPAWSWSLLEVALAIVVVVAVPALVLLSRGGLSVGPAGHPPTPTAPPTTPTPTATPPLVVVGSTGVGDAYPAPRTPTPQAVAVGTPDPRLGDGRLPPPGVEIQVVGIDDAPESVRLVNDALADRDAAALAALVLDTRSGLMVTEQGNASGGSGADLGSADALNVLTAAFAQDATPVVEGYFCEEDRYLGGCPWVVIVVTGLGEEVPLSEPTHTPGMVGTDPPTAIDLRAAAWRVTSGDMGSVGWSHWWMPKEEGAIEGADEYARLVNGLSYGRPYFVLR